MSFVWDDLDMQPLSRVKQDAVTWWGMADTMERRPNLAAKVAALCWGLQVPD